MILDYNNKIKITLFNSFKSLSDDLTSFLVPGNIALSGGSTYLQLLKYWSDKNLKLDNINFFPVDERVVDFEDNDSNWGNTYRIFLSKYKKNLDNHFINADEYNKKLNNIKMNTIFLGVGDDGHTASIFDLDSVFTEQDIKVINSISPKPPINRISFTGNYIIEADEIIIIFYGKGKEKILNQLLKGYDLPITRLLKKVNKGTIYIHEPLLGEINE